MTDPREAVRRAIAKAEFSTCPYYDEGRLGCAVQLKYCSCLDRADAAIAAYEAAQWRPISETPKDEIVEVAVARKAGYVIYPAMLRRQKGADHLIWVTPDTWKEGEPEIFGEGEGYYSMVEPYHVLATKDVHFWRPLPTPPETPHER